VLDYTLHKLTKNIKAVKNSPNTWVPESCRLGTIPACKL